MHNQDRDSQRISSNNSNDIRVVLADDHQLFRQGLKPQLVTMADGFAKAGLACLALAVLLAVFLTVSVVSARDTAFWFAGGLGLLFAVTWIVIPIWLRTRD